MGKQYQQSVGIVAAFYEITLIVAKNKMPHTIAEKLIMPAAKVLVKHVISDEAVSNLNSVLLSNNTIQQCITEMYTDINKQVITEVQGSKYGYATIWQDQFVGRQLVRRQFGRANLSASQFVSKPIWGENKMIYLHRH